MLDRLMILIAVLVLAMGIYQTFLGNGVHTGQIVQTVPFVIFR